MYNVVALTRRYLTILNHEMCNNTTSGQKHRFNENLEVNGLYDDSE